MTEATCFLCWVRDLRVGGGVLGALKRRVENDLALDELVAGWLALDLTGVVKHPLWPPVMILRFLLLLPPISLSRIESLLERFLMLT